MFPPRVKFWIEDESGLALIIVLGVVSLFAVLAAMLISSAKVTGINSKINVDRSLMKYAAESATAYTQWVIINFYYNNPNLNTGANAGIGDASESWWADGSEHQLNLPDNIIASVKIYDVNRGWDINQLKNRGEQLQIKNRLGFENPELQDRLEEFFAILNDYIDREDKALSHPDYGMENDEYAQLGWENFPRNGDLVFREEIYWIKNVEALAPGLTNFKIEVALPDDMFRILPPPGIRSSTGRKRTYSFWSAPIYWLETQIQDLTVGDRDRILDCRQKGFVDIDTIQQCLGFELFQKLQGRVSFDPKDTEVFTIDVVASTPNGDVQRRQVSTIDLKHLPTGVGDSNVIFTPPLIYWQKIFY